VTTAQRSSADIEATSLAYSVAGTGNRLDANPVDSGENTGRLSITLEKGAGRADEDRVMALMRQRLERQPGVQYQFSRPSLFALSSPLEVVISGYEIERLRVAAEQVRLRMQADRASPTSSRPSRPATPKSRSSSTRNRCGLARARRARHRRPGRQQACAAKSPRATRCSTRDRRARAQCRLARGIHRGKVRNLIVNPDSAYPVPLERGRRRAAVDRSG
jgi:HAE1 family hydrophobic/amphiphilic exporter-1